MGRAAVRAGLAHQKWLLFLGPHSRRKVGALGREEGPYRAKDRGPPAHDAINRTIKSSFRRQQSLRLIAQPDGPKGRVIIKRRTLYRKGHEIFPVKRQGSVFCKNFRRTYVPVAEKKQGNRQKAPSKPPDPQSLFFHVSHLIFCWGHSPKKERRNPDSPEFPYELYFIKRTERRKGAFP